MWTFVSWECSPSTSGATIRSIPIKAKPPYLVCVSWPHPILPVACSWSILCGSSTKHIASIVAQELEKSKKHVCKQQNDLFTIWRFTIDYWLLTIDYWPLTTPRPRGRGKGEGLFSTPLPKGGVRGVGLLDLYPILYSVTSSGFVNLQVCVVSVCQRSRKPNTEQKARFRLCWGAADFRGNAKNALSCGGGVRNTVFDLVYRLRFTVYRWLTNWLVIWLIKTLFLFTLEGRKTIYCLPDGEWLLPSVFPLWGTEGGQERISSPSHSPQGREKGGVRGWVCSVFASPEGEKLLPLRVAKSRLIFTMQSYELIAA